MQSTELRVDTSAPVGRINPRLYGHFAEHLGRCCYDGLRVDPNRSDIASENGFRSDVIAALKEMSVPLLRWPGGCYADHYHWRDGVGAPDSRTRSLGMSCGLQVIEDNSLGTHEFLWLCEQIGAEPYLAGNVGSGTPQELVDWVEYCNTPLPTTLGSLRMKNGANDPFGVKLWGVGNENWGCGGNMTPEGYANEYRRFATMLRHVDPGAELVVCGHTDAWNQALVASLRDKMELIDHFSIHSYWIEGGPETDFSADQYYHLFDEVERTEDFVKRTAALVANATGGKKAIGIALDEWGIWHPEAREWGPDSNSRLPQTYEQAGTLRDALAVGVMLEGFHRQCNVMSLANLAQVVNVLHAPIMTEGDKLWVTPTWHALRMHKPHIGATALGVGIEGTAVANDKAAVSATASRSDRGIAVTVINRHLEDGASIRIGGFDGYKSATAELLSAPSAASVNSASAPNAVTTSAATVTAEGGAWRIELPKHSMATIVFSN